MKDIIEIFKWGYGIESEYRLEFMNTRITNYISPFIPINDQEVANNLALAVQNGFCSKQTASEKFYHSTPNEWDRIQREKHEEDMHTLLVEEQRLEMQNDENLDYQEDLQEIQTDAQIEVINAQTGSSSDKDEKKKVQTRKGSVATGRGRGRPNRSGRRYDSDRNWEGRNNWDKYNQFH
jgi:Fe-S cluster assembly iron-binding protein IscA